MTGLFIGMRPHRIYVWFDGDEEELAFWSVESVESVECEAAR